jgi:hypothetical protein
LQSGKTSFESSSKLQSDNLQKPLTVHLANRLSVRLYTDSRPHCMETAPLQKGLVLILDNREVIEEGMGFGVPVVKYNDKTYFSSSADAKAQKNSSDYNLKKTFILDTISRKKLGRATYIDDSLYSLAHEKFAKLYLRHKNLTPFFNNIMELRNVAKIKTEFLKVKPRGEIIVNYEILPEVINISADFSNLTLDGCEELLLLNEQGSTIFDRYVDASGLELVGNKIGGWGKVTAKRASLKSSKKQVSFCLQKKYGASLFRGWENTKSRFSWAGLSYLMRPNHEIFRYSISLDFGGKTET